MKRWWFAAAVLVSTTSCSFMLDFPGDEGRACDAQGRCKAGYRCQANVCVKAPPDLCDPACAEWQQCVANQCQARYQAIEISTPADQSSVNGGPHPLAADLVLAAGATRMDPASLSWSITTTAGDPVASGVLVPSGTGGYRGSWTPTAEGSRQLTVSYPDAGLVSAPVMFTVDLTPPVLTLVVPSPPRSTDGGTLTEVDPFAPQAWRRDDVAPITAVSPAPDVDPASVKLSVQGVGDGGTSIDLPLAQATPCDAGYCGTVGVQLWTPRFQAFRGDLRLVLSWSDKAGNTGSASATLPVTRWKWEYAAGGGITVAPALGSTGRIYVGTAAGELLALSPAGAVQWQRQLATPIQASPVVGTLAGVREAVYVASSGSGGTLVALDGADGGTLDTCGAVGDFQGALALDVMPTQSAEYAYGVANTSATSVPGLVAFQASPTGPRSCTLLPNVPQISPYGGVVAKAGSAYYADPTGGLNGYTLAQGAFSSKTGWPVSLALGLHSLAFSGGQLLAGAGMSVGPSGAASVDEASAQVLWRNTATPSLGQLAITASHQALFGTDDATLAIVAAADGGTSLKLAGGNTHGAPIIGQGGYVYTADFNGGIWALRADTLDPDWDWIEPDYVGGVEASPTLDCSRDGQGQARPGLPGVLYIGANSGHLFAFIVDSRGLDTTADWPKYQHDPRNTGNPLTVLIPCP